MSAFPLTRRDLQREPLPAKVDRGSDTSSLSQKTTENGLDVIKGLELRSLSMPRAWHWNGCFIKRSFCCKSVGLSKPALHSIPGFSWANGPVVRSVLCHTESSQIVSRVSLPSPPKAKGNLGTAVAVTQVLSLEAVLTRCCSGHSPT